MEKTQVMYIRVSSNNGYGDWISIIGNTCDQCKNGFCSEGNCVCYSGWKGPTCDEGKLIKNWLTILILLLMFVQRYVWILVSMVDSA